MAWGTFLHDTGKNIAEVLLNIINTSLLEGVNPNEWKMAKFSPLFKSGNVSDINNYPPISVLNCVSKIIEKHVHKHFYEYFKMNFCHQYNQDFALSILVKHV